MFARSCASSSLGGPGCLIITVFFYTHCGLSLFSEFTCNKEDMQKAVNGSLRINKAFYGSLTDNVVDVPSNHSVSFTERPVCSSRNT